MLVEQSEVRSRMHVLIVTRLQLRSALAFPTFAYGTFLSIRQILRAPAFLGGRVLADGRAFWTMSAWESADAMRAYRNAHPHKGVMAPSLSWCDEFASARRTLEGLAFPTWSEAREILVTDGSFTKLKAASGDHEARRIRAPRDRLGAELVPGAVFLRPVRTPRS